MADNKIEQYLIDLKFNYQEIGKKMWLLDDSEHGFEGIVIMLNEPLVVFRSLIMDVPVKTRLELFTKLLELNAADVLHGAYGLENEKIVLVDTLEYDGMDENEFRATLDSFSLALTQHYPILSKYRS
ncbi:MAG: YbjN domain-containing protein [Treponema sp.]|nr:YbjN domain-containing protein [Treponema sp.]